MWIQSREIVVGSYIECERDKTPLTYVRESSVVMVIMVSQIRSVKHATPVAVLIHPRPAH